MQIIYLNMHLDQTILFFSTEYKIFTYVICKKLHRISIKTGRNREFDICFAQEG